MPESKKGPRALPIQFTCDGCPCLRTERWTEHLDNDETDSGTTATCTEVNKVISPYWWEKTGVPQFCPFATKGELRFKSKPVDGYPGLSEVVLPDEIRASLKLKDGLETLTKEYCRTHGLETPKEQRERLAYLKPLNAWEGWVE